MNEVAVTSRLEQVMKTFGMVESALEAALEPLGLSLPKWLALSHLAEAAEPLPLSALAEKRACVRSNITQLVDRLEADHLVKRSDDPRDRRSVRAELTEEGRTRYEAGREALVTAEKKLFAPLGPSQQEQLFGLLAAMRGER